MLTIIEDTRQQSGKHLLKKRWFDSVGISVVRSKLPAGDYALLTDMSRVIDSKQDLQEICGNLTQDHERFKREADFCMEHGIEFIVLIEESGMHCLEDVLKWQNKRMRRWSDIKVHHDEGKWMFTPLPPKPTSNETLYKIMKTFGEKHRTRWEFCSPRDAGRKIAELLTEGKETKW